MDNASPIDNHEIVARIVSDYSKYKPSYGEIDVELIIDRTRGHYEVMYSGWDGSSRIHGSVIHIDIRGDKIWIQHDGTEIGIANELIEAGVPRDKIVLAFHAPSERKHTPFAVG